MQKQQIKKYSNVIAADRVKPIMWVNLNIVSRMLEPSNYIYASDFMIDRFFFIFFSFEKQALQLNKLKFCAVYKI